MITRIQNGPAGFSDQAEELKAQALELAGTARERFAEGTARVKDYVVREPARALVIALALGVAVGWLIKRR
jgi:hypothetical protein